VIYRIEAQLYVVEKATVCANGVVALHDVSDRLAWSRVSKTSRDVTDLPVSGASGRAAHARMHVSIAGLGWQGWQA